MHQSKRPNSKTRRGVPRLRRKEQGEVSAWLVVAAGLTAAAAVAVPILTDTIRQLASDVGNAEVPAVSTVPGTSTQPVTLAATSPEPRSRTIVGPGDPVPVSTGPPDLAAPRPDEDSTENWFVSGDHSYTHISDPITADPNTIVDTMNNHGVHPNQTDPFTPGEPYVGDVDIPGPFGEDHVTSSAIYDSNGNQIGVRNETLPNHALHPGWVERTVVVDENGDYRIETYGEGTGSMGLPNVALDSIVWSAVDDEVIENLPEAATPNSSQSDDDDDDWDGMPGDGDDDWDGDFDWDNNGPNNSDDDDGDSDDDDDWDGDFDWDNNGPSNSDDDDGDSDDDDDWDGDFD